MIRTRITIREEDSCEEKPAEEEKKMLYVKLSEEHGEQERTPFSTRKLYPGFKMAAAWVLHCIGREGVPHAWQVHTGCPLLLCPLCHGIRHVGAPQPGMDS
jgi:hypothetical protein